MNMPHFWRIAAATLLALSWVNVVRAEDVQVAAFFGRYEGTGVTEKLETRYYGVTASDFDVEIGPAGEGFYVNWTRVDRTSLDAANTDVKRQTQRIQFVPSGHSGTYRTNTLESKIDGVYTWASITGQSLTISQVGVDAVGGLEVQIYQRTLTDLGMVLEASRVRNAEQFLYTRGRMIKVSQ
jgi:hypothetical protein